MKAFAFLRGLLLLALVPEALFGTDVPDESVMDDARHGFQELVRKHGYPVETHKVVTLDGYVLTLHRIPHGRLCPDAGGPKTPVLLVHGILSSSVCWVLAGPEKSLGYVLADACYDVWLGNDRGNYESRDHLALSTLSPAYWDFSWHEMGVHDVPCFVQRVLDVTNASALHYVGHSQGTTAFFVFNSLHPEHSRRFRSVQALAPVAYVSRMKSPLVRLLAPAAAAIEGFTDFVGGAEFLPANEVVSELGRQLCRDRFATSHAVCTNIFFLVGGFGSDQLNTTLLPVILSHTPAGASVKQFVHFLQNMRSGHFRQYDYSLLLNPIKYGSLRPPDYDLSNVRAPVALHYSLNDWFVDVDDLDRLSSQLPNLIGKFLVPLPEFNHVDFLWGKDAKTLLYDKVLEIMEKF